MKKSRIAKLALMGASITALAATLTTSTYAWYVSTTKADITNGSGATGTAGADESLLLSWTGATGSWYGTLDFANASTAVKNPLYPLSFHDGVWGVLDPSTGDSSTTASTAYIQFTVYLLSGTDLTVKPTITISNETAVADRKAQMIINEGASYVPTGAAEGVFKVDATTAIWTEQLDGSTKSYVAANTTATGGNAHNYYNAVKDESAHVLTAAAQTTVQTRNSGAATLANISLTADTSKQVTYTIFLDGGDVDCFNACVGQNISFTLSFEKYTAPVQP